MMSLPRIATVILLIHFAPTGRTGFGDELLVQQGPGFTLHYPKKHSRLLPPSARVAFSMEYRRSCFFRVETDELLQPINLEESALADIFLEIELGELRERLDQEIESHEIRQFAWGQGIELIYHLPAWDGKKDERDKVVEVLTTRGSNLFRFLYWIPEKELTKCEPVMKAVIDSFHVTLSSVPWDDTLRLEKRRAADAAEDLQSALETYGALVEAEPTRVEDRFRLAVLLRRAGRPDDAIRHYQQILELDPTLPRVYYNLAVVLLEDKDEPDRAENYFLRFLELDPENVKAEQVTSWLESRVK